MHATVLATLLATACSGRTPEPAPDSPADDAPADDAPADDAPADDGAAKADGATKEPTSLTAADCEAQGGSVVGDIGDGAIHRPGYTCAASGQPPIGTIVAEDGGPMGVEGAVCCK